MGFPRSSTGKESTKCRKTQFNIWVRKIPWRRDRLPTPIFWGFPEGLDGKEFTCIARYLGLIPGLGRSPGGGYGNLIQYFPWRTPKDRGAWQATVYSVVKSQTQLSG